MMHCSTCRFFGTLDGVTAAWEDGQDEVSESEHHLCARIIHGNVGLPYSKLSKELAVVTDGSGYAARLRVLPTFGCALHEPAK